MEKDLSTMPLYEIMDEAAKLEQEINLKIYKYNLLTLEVCRRFPFLETDDNFKQKTLKIKED